jgi:heptosyltransferase III
MTTGGEVGRPLVVSFGALGDSILLTALLDAVAVAWSRPCDVLLKRGPAVELLASLPAVGEVRALRSRRTPAWLSRQRREVTRWLAGRQRGPVYLPDEIAQPQVAQLLAEGGIAERETVSCRTVPRGDLEHKLDHLRRLSQAVAPAYPTSPRPPESLPYLPSLPVPAANVERCRQWLGAKGWASEPLVLFQTRSRNLQRGRWGDTRWTAALREILALAPGARAVMLGSAPERREVAKLVERMPDLPIWNLAGELPLPRLLALLALAHSCVSLDSGPAHAAAAVGCPVVVVLGRGDSRRNAPRPGAAAVRLVSAWPQAEWPATRREWEATHHMEEIRVEDVVAAWRSLTAVFASPSTVPTVYGPPPRAPHQTNA